ncbi:hypothetical protein [Mycolicibacterium septicum]|uniref:hypothetical protein n=1 Tax=Mycolicibacterium septicum TaxID=98668 RepID=UPI00235EF39C|nr:hypothetical protein [Mycolicibacterium septicum]
MSWLSAADAAKALGKTPAGLDAAIKSGALTARRVGWAVQVQVIEKPPATAPRKAPRKAAPKKAARKK